MLNTNLHVNYPLVIPPSPRKHSLQITSQARSHDASPNNNPIYILWQSAIHHRTPECSTCDSTDYVEMQSVSQTSIQLWCLGRKGYNISMYICSCYHCTLLRCVFPVLQWVIFLTPTTAYKCPAIVYVRMYVRWWQGYRGSFCRHRIPLFIFCPIHNPIHNGGMRRDELET